MSPAERLASQLGAPRGDRDGTKLMPMLCGRDESGERVLAQEGWIFELKLDGVRIIADKRGARVSLGYRKIRDATDSYPEIAEAVAKLGEERVVLDGEVVAFDAHGKPDFQRLGTRIQSRGSGARRAAHLVPVAFVVFDVLVIGDRDLTGLPIEARKRVLELLLGDVSKEGGHLRLHPTFASGTELFALCREHQLEGVVAKRARSTYRPDDRSSDWVKIKCEDDADLVVVGWTEGEGRRSRLGALDVAAYDGDRLVVQGSVGSGLDEDTIDELLGRLVALEVPKSVAEGTLSLKRARRYVRPEIVISVRHMGTTGDGLLRFPVFRGIRHDLTPVDCLVAPDPESTRGAPKRMRVTAPSLVVLGDGTTKGALCTYYEAVAPVMLPHLKGRICPLLRALARTQKGARGRAASAKLWPLPAWTPSWVRTGVVARGREEIRGVLVEDVETLRFLLEAGCASLLMTPIREATPASADFVALRIDGASAWRVALRARELVAATGLSAFVKTGGFAKLDVMVPIGAAPADAAHMLASLFARMLARFADELGVTVERQDAPFAPYALVLPMESSWLKPTVSLPLTWDELEEEVFAMTSLEQVMERVAALPADPMAEMWSAPADFAAFGTI